MSCSVMRCRSLFFGEMLHFVQHDSASRCLTERPCAVILGCPGNLCLSLISQRGCASSITLNWSESVDREARPFRARNNERPIDQSQLDLGRSERRENHRLLRAVEGSSLPT